MEKVELLAPAGDLEKLQFALHYGADAVYVGGEKYSLRHRAGNFTLDDLHKARDITREKGKKLYVAVNVFAHNNDIREMPAYLKILNELNVDGLIISDPGIFMCAREYAACLPITISTQANNCNWKTVQFWENLGATKICLARELTLAEIKEIREKTAMALEVFVHGSMCVAYSGRCLLSSYFVQRDANQGDCAQPCRWKYHLIEEIQPRDPLVIEEDTMGTYLLSSKDLCMIEHIPELIGAGVNSFKIEGRMRSLYYVSLVTRMYREAIEAYYQSPRSYSFAHSWLKELQRVTQRGYTKGFYFGPNPQDTQCYHEPVYPSSEQVVGVVKEASGKNKAIIKVCNQIRLEDRIEIFRKSTQITQITEITQTSQTSEATKVVGLWNDMNDHVDILHPGVIGTIEVDSPLYPFDLIRKKGVTGIVKYRDEFNEAM
jgi:putative protease